VFNSIEIKEKNLNSEYNKSEKMDIIGRKTLSPVKEILLTNKNDKICDTPKFDK